MPPDPSNWCPCAHRLIHTVIICTTQSEKPFWILRSATDYSLLPTAKKYRIAQNFQVSKVSQMRSTSLRFNFTNSLHTHATHMIYHGMAYRWFRKPDPAMVSILFTALVTNIFIFLSYSLVHPASSCMEKGSGVTSQNPWASSRSMEHPMKSQISVYWNNPEVRTSTSILLLKVMLWNSLSPHKLVILH